MKTSLVFPAALLAAVSIGGCSGEGSDPALRQSDTPSVAVVPPALVAGASTTSRIDRLPGQPPIPLASGEYRVALLWGRLRPERDSPVLALTWDIEVGLPWGTVAVESLLPGPNGSLPTVLPRPSGRVGLRSLQNTSEGAEGVVLSIKYSGVEPPSLFIGEGDGVNGAPVDLRTLDASPGGVLPLSQSGELAWAGFTVAPSCPRGFTLALRGPIDAGGHGPLFGEILTENGARFASLNGQWERERPPGLGSFTAGFQDLHGNTQGSIAGEFGRGTFTGTWHPHDQGIGGSLHGTLVTTGLGLGWLGTWSSLCPL